MPWRRSILAGALGAATTFLVAALFPHLWFWAFRPAWASGSVPGVTAATPFNAITVASRPGVDLYVVSPGAFAAAGGGPRPPAYVRTDADPAVYARVDTAVCGWPWRALASEAWVPVAGPVEFRCNWHAITTPDGPVLIPLRPLAGFLADTAVYGAAWYPLLLLPVLSPRWWREGRRLRMGRCPACGYDLRWGYPGGCPECGWRPGTKNVDTPAP